MKSYFRSHKNRMKMKTVMEVTLTITSNEMSNYYCQCVTQNTGLSLSRGHTNSPLG